MKQDIGRYIDIGNLSLNLHKTVFDYYVRTRNELLNAVLCDKHFIQRISYCYVTDVRPTLLGLTLSHGTCTHIIIVGTYINNVGLGTTRMC
jgi:hypothetical protein